MPTRIETAETRPSPSALLGALRGRSAIALADQVLISASNFATNIVLVRALGLWEYGKYSIAFLILLYLNALQLSFVGSPMLSIAPILETEEKESFVSGMFAVQALASVGLLLVTAVCGMLARQFTDYYSTSCILAFAFCVGTFQLQDWLRRYYFVHAKGKFTFLSDVLSYFLQLVVLVILWRLHRLTLYSTFVVMAVTSCLGFMLGFLTDRLRLSSAHLGKAWARCRAMSRDLVIVSQVRWLGVQGVLLIGTGIVGTVAAGGLRATLSLSGPMNLILTALENVLPLRLGEELRTSGAVGAYGITRKMMLQGTLLFLLIALPIGFYGRSILRLLYGPAMEPFYWPMMLQLISMVLQVASNMYVYFYRAVGDTRPLLRAYGLNALISVLTVYSFGKLWGATGIVLATLVGIASGVLYFGAYWMQNHRRIVDEFQSRSTFAGTT